MLIETNLNKSPVSIPKLIFWDKITKNPYWVLDNNAFTSQKKEKNVSHIIEHPDRKVEIKFENELT